MEALANVSGRGKTSRIGDLVSRDSDCVEALQELRIGIQQAMRLGDAKLVSSVRACHLIPLDRQDGVTGCNHGALEENLATLVGIFGPCGVSCELLSSREEGAGEERVWLDPFEVRLRHAPRETSAKFPTTSILGPSRTLARKGFFASTISR
ncbi:MAG: hypothetical protein QOI91_69 [Solirubrobacteraceae bacterium]|nr:hypothetical protein [Solirubrobacteraceae bacterium]